MRRNWSKKVEKGRKKSDERAVKKLSIACSNRNTAVVVGRRKRSRVQQLVLRRIGSGRRHELEITAPSWGHREKRPFGQALVATRV